jgi:hypothetical protein
MKIEWKKLIFVIVMMSVYFAVMIVFINGNPENKKQNTESQ